MVYLNLQQFKSMTDIFRKGLDILLKRQTSILSAAFIIMSTVILSQVLGIIKQRLLLYFFGPSNDFGVYLAASRLPDFLFQVAVGVALSSAFIPVFTQYLSKNEKKEAHEMASSLLTVGLSLFII